MPQQLTGPLERHARVGTAVVVSRGRVLKRVPLVVARAVVTAAGERHESRGCHHRLDHPEPRQPLERIVHFGVDHRIRVPAAVAVPEFER